MDQAFKNYASLAKGNPGCMHFLAELSSSSIVPVRTKLAIQTSGIMGTDLYVLWSDICERDMDKVIKLMDYCPLEILRDACSRQDYSGKEMVAQYFNEEDK